MRPLAQKDTVDLRSVLGAPRDHHRRHCPPFFPPLEDKSRNGAPAKEAPVGDGDELLFPLLGVSCE